MAESIGKMALMVTANISGLQAGLERGRKDISDFTSSTKGRLGGFDLGGMFSGGKFDLGSLAKAAGELAGPLGKAALPLLSFSAAAKHIHETAQEMKALAREADRLGVGVESMQAYQNAARAAGLEVNEVGSAVNKLQKLIAEAPEKEESAKKLALVNLSSKDLMGKSTEDQFALVARHVMSIQDHTTRARAEMELFGESGAKMELALRRVAEGNAGLILPKGTVEAYASLSKETAEFGRTIKWTADIAFGELAKAVGEVVGGINWILKLGEKRVTPPKLEDQAIAAFRKDVDAVADSAFSARSQLMELRGLASGTWSADSIPWLRDKSYSERVAELTTKFQTLQEKLASLQGGSPDKQKLAEYKKEMDETKKSIEATGKALAAARKQQLQAGENAIQSLRDSNTDKPQWMQDRDRFLREAKDLSQAERDVVSAQITEQGFLAEQRKKDLEDRKRAEQDVAEAVRASKTAEDEFVEATKRAHDWAQRGLVTREAEAALIGKAQKGLRDSWSKDLAQTKLPELVIKGSAEEYKSLSQYQAQLAGQVSQERRLAELVGQAQHTNQILQAIADKTDATVVANTDG